MKKQFATKRDLDEFCGKWEEENFSTFEEKIEAMLHPGDHGERIASDLLAAGYDLNDLIADGHGYQLGSHTNNGWAYRDEIYWDSLESMEREGRVRER
ncbi:MAG: hypothetical protein AAGU23_02640 [Bacillota bacterium]